MMKRQRGEDKDMERKKYINRVMARERNEDTKIQRDRYEIKS